MIYQTTLPHPALQPFVKEYTLIHFNLKVLMGIGRPHVLW